METVTLKLAPEMLAALRAAAIDDDVSIGQVVRDALSRDILRRQKAKTPNRADERLVAPLRSLLAQDFADAQSWADLQARLMRKGYHLAEAGGGLVVQDRFGARLCKGSELGHPYAQLARRFDSAFPGHRHGATFTTGLHAMG